MQFELLDFLSDCGEYAHVYHCDLDGTPGYEIELTLNSKQKAA